ncbi:hypothetical protein ACJX0J_041897 [Zea mays]
MNIEVDLEKLLKVEILHNQIILRFPDGGFSGKEGDPDSLLPIEDYRIWLQPPVLLIMSRLEVICSKLLGKFLLGFHFHDLPKDILFFLILILVFAGGGEEMKAEEVIETHVQSFLAVSPEIFLINSMRSPLHSIDVLVYGSVGTVLEVYSSLLDKYWELVQVQLPSGITA